MNDKDSAVAIPIKNHKDFRSDLKSDLNDEDSHTFDGDFIGSKSNYVIQLKNVHKTYLLGIEGVTALRGVSLNVKQGEFITILGNSGCGKTTMLNIIGTIDKPTKGEVWISGQKIKSTTSDKILASLRLHEIAFVFQTFNLLSSLTAVENVELPMILEGKLSRGEARKRALKLLDKVGLQERVHHFPNQLSGGEQQRVTIARALSNEPKILLLDEPTGDLDTKNSDLVMETLIELNRSGITMVMVTHDVNLKVFANRIVRMLDGKVQQIISNSDDSRLEAIRELKETIDNYSNPNAVNQQDNLLGVREGVKHNDNKPREGSPEEQKNDGSFKPKTKRKIEFRKPSDYEPIAYQQQQTQKITI